MKRVKQTQLSKHNVKDQDDTKALEGTDNQIVKPESIQDVLKYKYNIPRYQRGYRWGKEQVNALLKDLYEFYEHKKGLPDNNKEIYCIQPLVVKCDENSRIRNVVDGQQRLTTIYILVRFLNKAKIQKGFAIKYESRKESWNYLQKLTDGKSKITDAETLKYQDSYYMNIVNESIKTWIPPQKDTPWEGVDKKDFANVITRWVHFIRYNLPDYEKEIDVFKRLNIGRIKLTESELVKAIFLNKYNFSNNADPRLTERANEWDRIEYRLQDDRFWLFIHESEYDSPTRIDFILRLAMKSVDSKETNNNTYPVFDFYYNQICSGTDCKHRESKLKACWKEISKIYSVLCEWYNDEELYHYIGFLSTVKAESKKSVASVDLIYELIKVREECASKAAFVGKLKERIRKTIEPTLDLDYEYEGKNRKKKTVRPLLLMHNVQTIIDQNECIKNENKYNLPDFVRFPFHLYRKEWWDIEHIRPNNVQDFEGSRKKKLRRKYAYVLEHGLTESMLSDSKPIPNEVNAEVKKKIQDANGKTTLAQVIDLYEDSYEQSLKDQSRAVQEEELNLFNALWIVANSNDSELTETEKNKVWNYVLLDASTNREYGNSCFLIKRDFVMKKENGIKPMPEVSDKDVCKEQRVEGKEIPETAFVPICTMRVFAKTYTEYSSDLQYWTEKDAAYYRLDIEKRLWWYFFDKVVVKDIRDVISDKDKKSFYMCLFNHYYNETVKKANYNIPMKNYFDSLGPAEEKELFKTFNEKNNDSK